MVKDKAELRSFKIGTGQHPSRVKGLPDVPVLLVTRDNYQNNDSNITVILQYLYKSKAFRI